MPEQIEVSLLMTRTKPDEFSLYAVRGQRKYPLVKPLFLFLDDSMQIGPLQLPNEEEWDKLIGNAQPEPLHAWKDLLDA